MVLCGVARVAHGEAKKRQEFSKVEICVRSRQNRQIFSRCFMQLQGGSTNSPWRSDSIGRCDSARRLGFQAQVGAKNGPRLQFQNALEELRFSISDHISIR